MEIFGVIITPAGIIILIIIALFILSILIWTGKIGEFSIGSLKINGAKGKLDLRVLDGLLGQWIQDLLIDNHLAEKTDAEFEEYLGCRFLDLVGILQQQNVESDKIQVILEDLTSALHTVRRLTIQVATFEDFDKRDRILKLYIKQTDIVRGVITSLMQKIG